MGTGYQGGESGLAVFHLPQRGEFVCYRFCLPAGRYFADTSELLRCLGVALALDPTRSVVVPVPISPAEQENAGEEGPEGPQN